MAKIDLQLNVFPMLVFISVPLGEQFLPEHFAVSGVYAFLVQASPGGIYTLKGRAPA